MESKFITVETFDKINVELLLRVSTLNNEPQGDKPFIVVRFDDKGHRESNNEFDSIIDAVDYIHTLYFDFEITQEVK